MIDFFFQAEDGIRDSPVTGIQTCALPIFCFKDCSFLDGQYTLWGQVIAGMEFVDNIKLGAGPNGAVSDPDKRSEERRVGKECRSRWSPYH